MIRELPQKLKWQLILALARRLPACKVITSLASEARERPLTVREKITLKLHLFTCEACRRYVAQVERMSQTIKSAAGKETFADQPSVKLSDDARKRIKAALEAAAQQKH